MDNALERVVCTANRYRINLEQDRIHMFTRLTYLENREGSQKVGIWKTAKCNV